MKKIGFIGVGIMGKSMVRNLMKAGFEVSIYARTKAKVEDVLQEGALWCNSIGSCAAGKDAVITIVGFPKDVEEVYFAEGNILDSAAAGTYLIDMTTTSPQLAIRIYEKAKKNGQHAQEAKDRDVNLEVLNTVLEMYETLEDKGMGDLGTQGLMKYYEES